MNRVREASRREGAKGAKEEEKEKEEGRGNFPNRDFQIKNAQKFLVVRARYARKLSRTGRMPIPQD
ncbi:hypothetical protein ACSQ6I_06535 [Anabaena sp. WFMT]|uniref:hypothetical protein n=1 Tax=Anabaena sp. WFMT TaxID=3449730 RepID=UPI003F29B0E9